MKTQLKAIRASCGCGWKRDQKTNKLTPDEVLRQAQIHANISGDRVVITARIHPEKFLKNS